MEHTDKQIEYLIDAKVASEENSNCCDAPVINGRCSDCKENA